MPACRHLQMGHDSAVVTPGLTRTRAFWSSVNRKRPFSVSTMSARFHGFVLANPSKGGWAAGKRITWSPHTAPTSGSPWLVFRMDLASNPWRGRSATKFVSSDPSGNRWTKPIRGCPSNCVGRLEGPIQLAIPVQSGHQRAGNAIVFGEVSCNQDRIVRGDRNVLHRPIRTGAGLEQGILLPRQTGLR